MTDRQFVIQSYPNAWLDYVVRPRNTMAPRIYYQILEEPLNFGKIIAKGETRLGAWRNAKRKIIKMKKINYLLHHLGSDALISVGGVTGNVFTLVAANLNGTCTLQLKNGTELIEASADNVILLLRPFTHITREEIIYTVKLFEPRMIIKDEDVDRAIKKAQEKGIKGIEFSDDLPAEIVFEWVRWILSQGLDAFKLIEKGYAQLKTDQ